MRLPRAEQASVDPAKLRDYLLSREHPIGRFKAVFFESLGYSAANWQQLEVDLRQLLSTEDAALGELTAYGQKYEVRGILTGPSGRVGSVLTVWIIRSGEEIPRFVTAFPGDRE